MPRSPRSHHSALNKEFKGPNALHMAMGRWVAFITFDLIFFLNMECEVQITLKLYSHMINQRPRNMQRCNWIQMNTVAWERWPVHGYFGTNAKLAKAEDSISQEGLGRAHYHLHKKTVWFEDTVGNHYKLGVNTSVSPQAAEVPHVLCVAQLQMQDDSSTSQGCGYIWIRGNRWGPPDAHRYRS